MEGLLKLLRAELGRVGGFLFLVLGAIAVLIGYQGVATSDYLAQQLAYVVSGGIGGLFLLGTGATLLISSDLHDEWRKLDRLEAAIQSLADTESVPRSQLDAWIVAPEGERAVSASAERGFSRPAMLIGVCTLLAAAALGLSWNHAASIDDPRQGLSAIALAVAVLIAYGVAALVGTLWERRLVHVRGRELLRPFAGLMVEGDVAALRGGASDRPAIGDLAPVVLLDGASLTRFHRPGCPATAGHRTAPLPDGPSRLRPCGICHG